MAQTVCVVVGDADQKQLESIAADRNRPHKHVQRALIVLLSSKRLTVAEVAREAGVSRPAIFAGKRVYAAPGRRSAAGNGDRGENPRVDVF